MIPFSLLLLAPTAVGSVPDLIPGAEKFDLKRVEPSPSCGRGGADAIVVCGRRAKSETITVKHPGRFESGPLRAETRFGGGTLDVHGEQHGFPDGRSAPAAMVRFKLPF